MRKLRWFRLFLIIAVLGIVSPAAAKAPNQDDATGTAAQTALDGWYIVQFSDPPLATYAKSAGIQSMMFVSGRLNVRAGASQAYVRKLQSRQVAFQLDLTKAMPGVQIGRAYQVVLNAVAVKLADSTAEAVRVLMAMPGVERVSPQTIYTVDMDYSLPAINAPAMWAALGDRPTAGEGIKIAVVDTGIDPTHPMFDGTDFGYPTTDTWPKGYCADHAGFCNGKVIAANYSEPTFEVHEDEVLSPMDVDGHGTHVSGTSAGNIVTATYGTEVTQISGVAPGAWLMAYKGLYHTPSGNGSGSNIMLAGAVEDAVSDGADVINNSWGSDTFVMPSNDPLVKAYEAAVDAGVVVVFSVGNAGDGYNTAGNPTSEKFIQVGASTTERAFYNTISVTAPTPVTDTLQMFPGNQFADIAPSAFPTTAIGPLPYIPCDLLGVPDTTLAGVTAGITQTAPYTGGWIALIPRGTYNFTDKLDNAIGQGASAAVMYTDDRTWKGGFTAGDRDIYTVMTDYGLGLEARDWWETYTDTAKIQIGYPVSAWVVETPNVIADFSSRGPDATLLIKPDVIAPGVNILSAQPGGVYDSFGGTSMSSPHVTGAVALLLAAHPEWTPAQVKSALMSTASQTILDLDEATVADIMTQGSGLIDLSVASDPGLTFDKPSESFGMVPRGEEMGTVITAVEVAGMVETYTLSIDEWVSAAGEVTFTLSSVDLAMTAGASESFTLTVDVAPDASLMDLEGNVVISGTEHIAHIPYWVRVVPAATGQVLLVDFDLNEFGAGGDYQGYYTNTLENLSVAYDIWDVGGLGGHYPSRAAFDLYDKVILFTGDNYLYWMEPIADDIRMYLATGGKMLITGQDVLGNDGLASWPFVRGAANVPLNDGAFPMAVGMADYAPFLKGKAFDAYSAGDGAGNQAWVDELDWYSFSDLDTGPLFEIPNTAPAVQDGVIGVKSAWEPNIERVQNPVQFEEYSWRVVFLGFGLEGVNNDTGYNTREELVDTLFDWMDDEVTVSFDQPSYRAGGPLKYVQLTATMSATIGTEAIYYAWDFGDGSPVDYTTTPFAQHQYHENGFYTVYVEAMDEYTHKAVGETVEVEVGSHFYLPIIAKAP